MSCEDSITVTEPGREQYSTWAFDHKETLKEACREAGASETFIRMLDSYQKGVRHSVLMTLYRHHASAETDPEDANLPNVDDVKEAQRLGGGFFGKLWDGELCAAFTHADHNNQKLMLDEFTVDEIVANGIDSEEEFPSSVYSPEYIRGLVEERAERHED